MEKKLLIVEDFPSFLKLWPIAAKRHFDATTTATASTVVNAVAAIRDGEFTHIILDGSLHDNNRCDTLPVLAAALKANIVVIAASSMYNDELLSAGAHSACDKGEVFERLGAGTLFHDAEREHTRRQKPQEVGGSAAP